GPSWVAVVGNSWWLANNALDAASPVFAAQPKPAGPWLAQALRAGLSGGATAIAQDDGDAAAALAQPGTITADYSVPHLAHAALEPMNATARISTDGELLRAEVWAPTQSVTLATWAVARALGIDDAAVTVYPTLLGGSFGRKVEVDCIVQAALIARAVKRPVQLIYSREEDFAQDKFRPAAAARLRARLGPAAGDAPAASAGSPPVTAWGVRIAVADPGWYMMRRVLPALASDAPKASAGAIEGAYDLPYDLGAVRAEHALVDLPVAAGIWRSVGHSFSAFFVESFIDELAHAAGTDPYAFRLALLRNAPRHAAVLRAAMRLGGPLGLVEPGVARGIALHESFGSIVAVIAEVAATPGEITVRRLSGAIDCGQVVNPGIVAAQV
ncbi:MAG: molybdopterin cofactor-binding domain-containing protein, partial [Polymorphobacter sp.]